MRLRDRADPSCCRLIELPFAFYQGYRARASLRALEPDARAVVRDQAKGAALGAIVRCRCGASLVYCALRGSPTWWWALSAAVFTVAMVGLVQLAPVLLLPLFYSFKPLDRPALVDRLLALADRARTQHRRRLRVGAERAHQESQRGAGRHGADAPDPARRTRCSPTTRTTRSRWCSRTSSRITSITICGAAWRCRRVLLVGRLLRRAPGA